MSSVRWQGGVFDKVLKDVADDATGPTLWCDREYGRVFAPYDGGFDLFPISMAEVAELKARHKDWLSKEPSGL